MQQQQQGRVFRQECKVCSSSEGQQQQQSLRRLATVGTMKRQLLFLLVVSVLGLAALMVAAAAPTESPAIDATDALQQLGDVDPVTESPTGDVDSYRVTLQQLGGVDSAVTESATGDVDNSRATQQQLQQLGEVHLVTESPTGDVDNNSVTQPLPQLVNAADTAATESPITDATAAMTQKPLDAAVTATESPTTDDVDNNNGNPPLLLLEDAVLATESPTDTPTVTLILLEEAAAAATTTEPPAEDAYTNTIPAGFIDETTESPTVNADAVEDGMPTLPKYFPKACPRNATNFNECVRKNMQEVMPHLAHGEALFNMPPLEPLAVDDFHMEHKYFAFNYQSVAESIRLHGVTALRVRAVRAKVTDDSLDMECDLFFPEMSAEGSYRVDGKFGIFSYVGRGPWNLTMTNVDTTFHLTGNAVARTSGGVKFLHLNRFVPDVKADGLQFYAGNEIKEYEGVTTLATNMFNQFWRPLLPSVVKASQSEIERGVMKYGKGVFDSVPFAQIFPAS